MEQFNYLSTKHSNNQVGNRRTYIGKIHCEIGVCNQPAVHMWNVEIADSKRNVFLCEKCHQAEMNKSCSFCGFPKNNNPTQWCSSHIK